MTRFCKTGCLLLALMAPAGAAQAAGIDPADAALDAALAAAEASCAAPILDLTAEGRAQLGVTLLAPCRAGEKVVLDHGGLVLTSVISAQGGVYASLPMLVSDAPVTVTFADGTMAEAYVSKPQLEHIQEVAARW